MVAVCVCASCVQLGPFAPRMTRAADRQQLVLPPPRVVWRNRRLDGRPQPPPSASTPTVYVALLPACGHAGSDLAKLGGKDSYVNRDGAAAASQWRNPRTLVGDIGQALAACVERAVTDAGLMTRETRPFHVLRRPSGSGEGRALVGVHCHPGSVLLIVLQGSKTVWVGPKTKGLREFVGQGADQRRWVPVDESGDTWDQAEPDVDGGWAGPLDRCSALRRLSLGPGDALHIPTGAAHAVATHRGTLAVSASVKQQVGVILSKMS